MTTTSRSFRSFDVVMAGFTSFLTPVLWVVLACQSTSAAQAGDTGWLLLSTAIIHLALVWAWVLYLYTAGFRGPALVGRLVAAVFAVVFASGLLSLFVYFAVEWSVF